MPKTIEKLLEQQGIVKVDMLQPTYGTHALAGATSDNDKNGLIIDGASDCSVFVFCSGEQDKFGNYEDVSALHARGGFGFQEGTDEWKAMTNHIDMMNKMNCPVSKLMIFPGTNNGQEFTQNQAVKFKQRLLPELSDESCHVHNEGTSHLVVMRNADFTTDPHPLAFVQEHNQRNGNAHVQAKKKGCSVM